MALSRVTTWSAGQVLTAAALNAEYDNILNNPLPLISTASVASKGGLLVGNGSALAMLTVGSNDQVLTADSTQVTGTKWAAVSAAGSPGFNSITSGTNTIGAMVVGSAASLVPTGTGIIRATDLIFGSDARGDITFRGASVYGRLAKGSAATVLQMGANDPAWFDLFGTANTFTASQKIDYTSTETVLNVTPIYSRVLANPGGATVGAYRNWFQVGTTAANAQNLAAFAPVWGYGSHEGTGTLTSLYGLVGQIKKLSTGPITNVYGVLSEISNSNATNAITNAYGLYVASMVRTGAITNSWGVYVADTTANNYFGGFIGIGMTPTKQLELSTDSAQKPTTNTWTITSDARFKSVQREFIDGLAVARRITPVWYRHNGKSGYRDDGEHVGIVAQELLPIAPYMIGTFKGRLDEQEDVTLYNYQGHALPFILVNAVKELDARLTAIGG